MQNTCPITCEKIEIPMSLSCGHVFEKEPILIWLKSNKSCPMCRTVQPCDDDDEFTEFLYCAIGKYLPHPYPANRPEYDDAKREHRLVVLKKYQERFLS